MFKDAIWELNGHLYVRPWINIRQIMSDIASRRVARFAKDAFWEDDFRWIPRYDRLPDTSDVTSQLYILHDELTEVLCDFYQEKRPPERR